MYGRRNLRFLLGAALIVVLVIVVLVIVLTPSSPKPLAPRPLDSYANDPTAQVAMLIDGPVTAESEHNQLQIFINNSGTTVNVFQGYNNHVINSQNIPLSENGFYVFLRSLSYAGFNKGNNDPALANASGYCPTGDRYIFSFNSDGKQLKRYWISTCGGDPHTYNGNFGLTTTLFASQVPDYSSIVNGLNL